jgi:S-DNA-T family DNA segregation ATPase FtsK/SpoIIIE
MAASLLEGGSRVLAVTPRRSPLRDLEGRPGVAGVLAGGAIQDSALHELVEAAEGPLAVCVDDVELIGDNPKVSDALQAILRQARDRGHALVVAGTTSELGGFRGLAYEVRKSRTGLLLWPESGELLGMRLPKTAHAGGPAGRGLLVVDGGYTMTQVVLP